jgi:hypothetical protein
MQIELSFTGLYTVQQSQSLNQLNPSVERENVELGAHLRAHLRQQIILIHENTLASKVRRDSLDVRQARLDIIAEPLAATIRRHLLDDFDDTPALKRDLLPRLSPARSQHLKRATHTERIIIPHRDPRWRYLSNRRAPLPDERAPRERVVL